MHGRALSKACGVGVVAALATYGCSALTDFSGLAGPPLQDGAASDGVATDSAAVSTKDASVPISFARNVGQATSADATVTSLAIDVNGGGCAAGDLVVVRFTSFNFDANQSPTIADDRKNTWNSDFIISGANNGFEIVWSSILTTALLPNDKITATFAPATQQYVMVADEFTGANLTSPPYLVDNQGVTDTNGSLTATPSDSLQIAGSALPNSLLVLGVVFTTTSTGYTEPTDTIGGDSWHPLTRVVTTGTNGLGTNAAYKIISTSTPVTITYDPVLSAVDTWQETILAY